MWLYAIFAFFDNAIYSMVKFGIKLIMLIANYDFFKQPTIEKFSNKVYVVLGVLMLFKLVVSAIQYMVNPDTFDDKDKGMGGILKKLVICMVLLVTIRPIFNFAMYAQKSIVSTIPGLILDDGNNYNIANGGASTTSDKFEEIGDKVAGSTIKTFVSLKEDRIAAGKTDEISTGEDSLKPFNEHIKDGCVGSLTKGLDMDLCDYDYRFGISTVAGAFLLYVIISMTLDVGIRAIKLGIIQMLAPIPISGYIVSKDKLSKFFKVAKDVYIDLFVRLGIVYFIIFFVREIIDNMGNEVKINDVYTATSFETAFVKIAIIIALFMFAKNAPKFICDVLGIDGGGFGDMKDMFKPAWQRMGGAAGALVNPVRNAVSNTRDAWKNNIDMVDSRGGKLRRAMQNARRVGNATRHGLGGALKGAADVFAGAAAGDDWAKMNQRHRNAIATSKRRSAEGYMKRTDNDVRQEFNDQRRAIERDFKAQGIDINRSMSELRSKAADTVHARLDGYNNQIANLQHRIAEGKLNGASNAQIQQWNNDLQTAIANRDRLSTKAGFDAEVAKEVQSAKSALVQKAIQGKTTAIRQQLNDNNQRMSNIMTKLSDPTISASDRATAEATYAQLMNESDQLRAQLTPAGLTAMKEQYSSDLDKQIEIRTDKLDKQRDISGGTILKGKVDSFFGGEGFTGKGYIDTADLLKNNRSSLYTGEAMTKMRQNADILVEADGTPAKFTARFTMPSAGDVKLTYAEMADLKKQVDNGRIDIKELQKKGFENGAMVQSAFEDMEKQAAEAYVTANMAAADPSVTSTFKLKGNPKANATIVEGIKRMKAQIASANIPKEEKDALLKELSENPGKFFKGASDRQEKMRTKGSRISAYNSGKKDN